MNIQPGSPNQADAHRPAEGSLFRHTWLQFALIGLTYGMAMASPAFSQPTGYDEYQVVQIAITSEAELGTLRELQGLGRDFQLWSEALGIGPVEVRVAPAAKPALDASGLCYEVVIENLQQHIDELYGSGRSGDFFDYLRGYDEHVQFMTDLVAAYPDLAEMITVGLSVEGREMWALRITGPGENKPGVMYHGAQHGNEQAGASVVAYAAQHLLTNYDTDPEVTALIDNVEWFLLPIMNPDGYVYYDRDNVDDVDLNRNWGGPGSGENGSGGPYPFSEPETAGMRDFFLAHPNVRVHIDFHGYAPWIMWPWGHTPDLTIDHWTFHILGREVHDLLLAGGGGDYAIGTVWDVAYPVYGGSTNYTYGEFDLWALTFELVDDDLPEILEEFLPTMLFLSGWIFDCNGNAIPDADDIAAGTSTDCNINEVPDECESQADCNGDGVLDLCDFIAGVPDCNGNAIPDSCDLDQGTSEDCTGNGVPDECEPDCNENGIADSCDIANGTMQDCNANGIPDDCEPDCNENGVADSCDIADGTSQNCNANDIPDDCERDCNTNGAADDCDIADGTSQDEDGDGVPDECEDRFFVNRDAPSGGDGATWAAAFRDLQDALDAAGSGDEIWVASGTYNAARGTGDRTATFQLITQVAIYGGFAGWEKLLEQRDWINNETILSGDLNGDDVGDLDDPSRNENSYHIVTGSGTETTAILDGFTITGANADDHPEHADGGGMHNDQGSPTVSNCAFNGNSVNSQGGGMYNADSSPTLIRCTFTGNYGGGGGMYNGHDSRPSLTHCTFSDNTGSGMYNYDESSPTLINCTFNNNNSGLTGGGMYNCGDSSPTLTDCTFSGNSAEQSGGGMYNEDSSPTLVNCTFNANTAGSQGGGMYNHFGSSPMLTNCTFNGNSAWSGGGMHNTDSTSNPTLLKCTFSDNLADYSGGGMNNVLARPSISNCLFSGNSAGSVGGGMRNNSGRPAVTNCTFSANSAVDSGGGMGNYGSRPTVSNCTFVSNSAANGRGVACDSFEQSYPSNLEMSNCILWDGGDEVWNNDESTITITYTDVQDGWPGEGNIDEDPLFVDPDGSDDIPGTEDDNFRLLMDSPCIDAGDPLFIPEPEETDLDGHARVLCSRVDMGPYEFGIGDYDCDQVVDLTDFAAWQGCMTGPHSGPYGADCEPFDFDYDGHVDLQDFAGFQDVVAGGNP